MKYRLSISLLAFGSTLVISVIGVGSGCGKSGQEDRSDASHAHSPVISEGPRTNADLTSGQLPINSQIASAGNEEHIRNSATNKDDKIIQLVRHWYETNGMKAPTRIVIHGQKGSNWIVLAGPQWSEMGFEVDTTTSRVVRAVGD
jgi:hypothetical protein